MTNKLKAISLFSGCGGFDYGAQEAGLDIIWANDINPHASHAYRGLFPRVEFHEGDIRDITSFPSADVLIGCYPCTGFSMAARRRGKDLVERNLKNNENNFLYREFIRALTKIQPRYIFIENVGGMVSAHDGWFFEQQITGFEKLGYNIKHDFLNAANFGIAQNRKRMFIVGIHKDIKQFKYSFQNHTHGPNTNQSYVVMQDVIGDMNPWPEGDYCKVDFHGHYLTRNRKRKWTEPSFTIVAHAHHVPLHPMGEPMRYVKKDTWVLQGDINRRLSWRECARIQGLPDNINPSGQLIDKYRVIGNAVPPILGKVVVSPILN